MIGPQDNISLSSQAKILAPSNADGVPLHISNGQRASSIETKALHVRWIKFRLRHHIFYCAADSSPSCSSGLFEDSMISFISPCWGIVSGRSNEGTIPSD